MAKVGRPKKIETPEELLKMFSKYKREVKENFRYNAEYDVTVEHYLQNSRDAYDEFRTISTRIRKEIRNDQINGGMVGQYNPSITARLNALKEQIEQTNIEQPLFPDVSTNDGNK